MAEFIFYSIAACCCIFAFLTISARDVFHSAVWLSMTLLSVAGIYFYLGADFLGVIQVLVYIGGIITLFIFAIKLTARIGDKTIRQLNQQAILAATAAFTFFLFLLKMISARPWAPINPQIQNVSLQDLGRALLSTYVLPFEYISVILLASMIGAIVLGKVRR